MRNTLPVITAEGDGWIPPQKKDDDDSETLRSKRLHAGKKRNVSGMKRKIKAPVPITVVTRDGRKEKELPASQKKKRNFLRGSSITKTSRCCCSSRTNFAAKRGGRVGGEEKKLTGGKVGVNKL